MRAVLARLVRRRVRRGALALARGWHNWGAWFMVHVPCVMHELIRELARVRQPVARAAFVKVYGRVDGVAEADAEVVGVEAKVERVGGEATLQVEDVLPIAIRTVDDGLRCCVVVESLRRLAADPDAPAINGVLVLHLVASGKDPLPRVVEDHVAPPLPPSDRHACRETQALSSVRAA